MKFLPASSVPIKLKYNGATDTQYIATGKILIS